MTTPYNPPAFPSQPYGESGLPMSDPGLGMTLRDWFAGQALAGMLAQPMAHGVYEKPWSQFADDAYRMADAMLKERAK